MDALTRGIVIRAGNSLNLFAVRGATPTKQLRAAQSRVNLVICYCSIAGQCWTNSLAGVIPHSVSVCAESDDKGLELPGPLASDLHSCAISSTVLSESCATA